MAREARDGPGLSLGPLREGWAYGKGVFWWGEPLVSNLPRPGGPGRLSGRQTAPLAGGGPGAQLVGVMGVFGGRRCPGCGESRAQPSCHTLAGPSLAAGSAGWMGRGQSGPGNLGAHSQPRGRGARAGVHILTWKPTFPGDAPGLGEGTGRVLEFLLGPGTPCSLEIYLAAPSFPKPTHQAPESFRTGSTTCPSPGTAVFRATLLPRNGLRSTGSREPERKTTERQQPDPG